ncbi:VWA domain-containing protein [Streptacidiphilus griseoplanus]|uniref:VWA domain-containing protein n=1 Tax=Peterkaempfera griseoplana TaxID=66896 RepID=UPI0007C80F09|nr:VWA domain-containing protein [Peterkaempfera griseoplana]
MSTPADRPGVELTIHQDEYHQAGPGRRDIQAVVSVTVTGVRPVPASAAEVVVIDCSESMSWPQSKIEAARRATAAAVGLLRDGTRFAVVEGTDSARVVYPRSPSLAVAGAGTRAEAVAAVRRLRPGGGTAMGTWLTLARELLEQAPGGIRHVLLLTDGRNETEPPGRLQQVLAACEGRFTCDARGIGDGWDARELGGIATRLHGTAAVVLQDADLEAEFTGMMRASLSRALPDLRLRLTPLPGVTLRYLRQVHPTEVDLTAAGRPAGERAVEFPTDPWASETRHYQLCLTADPDGRPRDERLMLADVQLTSGDTAGPELPPPAPVLVRWTDGAQLSAPNPVSVHFSTHGRLGEAVADAYHAHREGDRARAEAVLDRVLRLAHQLGDRSTLDVLADLLVSTEPDDGPARLRERFDRRHFDRLLLSSRHSAPVPDGAPLAEAHSQPPGPDLTCPVPDCGTVSPPGSAFCWACGTALREAR